MLFLRWMEKGRSEREEGSGHILCGVPGGHFPGEKRVSGVCVLFIWARCSREEP